MTDTKQKTERKLVIIIAISFGVMILEIISGSLFGSMALLADGWHMGTHVFALGVALAASIIGRKLVGDPRFNAAKVSSLGGFAGAILLGIVAVEIAIEGVHRLLNPESIRFTEAIVVATIGLSVNALGAFLLHEGAHTHDDGDAGHHHNMRSAYLHVIADALTSVLAIAALVLGRMFGWVWLDAAVALVGGAVILKWALGLLKTSGGALLDYSPDLKPPSNSHAR